jgi:hypothetical protein
VTHARRLTALAVGLVTIVGLGACTSQPSVQAVARDVVESIGLEPEQETCMLEAIDGYSEDELQQIGEANETVDFSSDAPPEDRGTEALQKFYADLDACMGAG